MKGKSGQVLIFALILMGVGVIVIWLLLDYVDSSNQLWLNTKEETDSYLAADAGMEAAISNILQCNATAPSVNLSDSFNSSKIYIQHISITSANDLSQSLFLVNSSVKVQDGRSIWHNTSISADIYLSPGMAENWSTQVVSVLSWNVTR